jgi:hypothetical protein
MSDADEIRPEPVPVSAEQLAAGKDAEPAEVVEQSDVQRLAEASHDDAGPEQEQPE